MSESVGLTPMQLMQKLQDNGVKSIYFVSMSKADMANLMAALQKQMAVEDSVATASANLQAAPDVLAVDEPISELVTPLAQPSDDVMELAQESPRHETLEDEMDIESGVEIASPSRGWKI